MHFSRSFQKVSDQIVRKFKNLENVSSGFYTSRSFSLCLIIICFICFEHVLGIASMGRKERGSEEHGGETGAKRGANGSSDVDVGGAAITVHLYLFVISLSHCENASVCAFPSLFLTPSLAPSLADSLFSISIPISIQIAISFPSLRLRPQERVPFAERSAMYWLPFFTFVFALVFLLFSLPLLCFFFWFFCFIIYSTTVLCVWLSLRWCICLCVSFYNLKAFPLCKFQHCALSLSLSLPSTLWVAFSFAPSVSYPCPIPSSIPQSENIVILNKYFTYKVKTIFWL